MAGKFGESSKSFGLYMQDGGHKGSTSGWKTQAGALWVRPPAKHFTMQVHFIVNNRISGTPLTSPSISPYWPPPSTVLLAFKWACTPLPHVWTRPTVPLTALPSEVYPLDSFTSLNSDLLKETHLIDLQFNTETCSPYFPPP